MFQPLIDSNEKQTENINKNIISLEENMKKTSQIVQSGNQAGTTGGKSILVPNDDGSFSFGGTRTKNEAKFIIMDNKEGEKRLIHKNKNEEVIYDIPFTEGTEELLLKGKFNEDKVTKEDLLNYISIYEDHGEDIGSSARVNSIKKLASKFEISLPKKYKIEQ